MSRLQCSFGLLQLSFMLKQKHFSDRFVCSKYLIAHVVFIMSPKTNNKRWQLVDDFLLPDLHLLFDIMFCFSLLNAFETSCSLPNSATHTSPGSNDQLQQPCHWWNETHLPPMESTGHNVENNTRLTVTAGNKIIIELYDSKVCQKAEQAHHQNIGSSLKNKLCLRFKYKITSMLIKLQ